MKFLTRMLVSGILLVGGLILLSTPQAGAREAAQQPTSDIPTATNTPTGPVIRVNEDNDFLRVRSGPGTEYDELGRLDPGEIVFANGKTVDGIWIQIAYPSVESGIGWVYSPYVTLVSGGDLPIVEPAPTATPLVTATIDQTLAAQFIDEVPPTRLPTYTAPPPLVISTFEPGEPASQDGGFPVVLVIILLGAVGIIGTLFAILRGR